MSEPCGNENCLRCYPELKTFEVERERVERIVRSLGVRAVDEEAALAVFMEEASGPGSYLFDCARGPTLEVKDPVVKRVADHTAHCWHDGVDHLAGCTIRVPRDPANEFASRHCDCTLGEPWRKVLIQREAERAAAAVDVPAQDRTPVFTFDISSCHAVGDAGCCDPDCWYCHSPIGPENLRRLADNLATAAALCRAWQLRDLDPAWRPGCLLDGDR
jgi:hypothetical protein